MTGTNWPNVSRAHGCVRIRDRLIRKCLRRVYFMAAIDSIKAGSKRRHDSSLLSSYINTVLTNERERSPVVPAVSPPSPCPALPGKNRDSDRRALSSGRTEEIPDETFAVGQGLHGRISPFFCPAIGASIRFAITQSARDRRVRPSAHAPVTARRRIAFGVPLTAS